MAITKKERRERIKKRVRKIVTGAPERPRMSVFRSNKQISVQLIDDLNGQTVIAASSLEKGANVNGTKIEQAREVGKRIAEKAVSAGINEVAFDRNGYLYHGRVKALAEGAREGGLKF